jgi:hypothetical protein
MIDQDDLRTEHQIISMIKDILKDETDESKEINSSLQEVKDDLKKFNLNLLDFNSPEYQRKTKRCVTNSEVYKQKKESALNFPQFTYENSNELSYAPKAFNFNSSNDLQKAYFSERGTPNSCVITENIQTLYRGNSFSTNNLTEINYFNKNKNYFSNNNDQKMLSNVNYLSSTALITNNNSTANSSIITGNNFDYTDNFNFKRRNSGSIVEEKTKKILIDTNEETLEFKMTSLISITDEYYEKFQGKFIEIVTNQNCSRILQNCLINTSDSVLSKILQEV